VISHTKLAFHFHHPQNVIFYFHIFLTNPTRSDTDISSDNSFLLFQPRNYSAVSVHSILPHKITDSYFQMFYIVCPYSITCVLPTHGSSFPLYHLYMNESYLQNVRTISWPSGSWSHVVMTTSCLHGIMAFRNAGNLHHYMMRIFISFKISSFVSEPK